MADDLKAEDRVEPELDGRGLRIGIAASRFNDHVTRRLFEGVRRGLAGTGVAEADITEVWVPGAFEIPLMLRKLAEGKSYDALIALGAVVRGGTPHFDYVCDGATYGTMKVMLETGIPVAFGCRHASPDRDSHRCSPQLAGRSVACQGRTRIGRGPAAG